MMLSSLDKSFFPFFFFFFLRYEDTSSIWMHVPTIFYVQDRVCQNLKIQMLRTWPLTTALAPSQLDSHSEQLLLLASFCHRPT